MNLEAFAFRLYHEGHKPEDFVELAPGHIVVEAVRPPSVTLSGLELPATLQTAPAQVMLAHRVVAKAPDVEWIGVGDVVKVYEAHLDPVDPKGRYCSIRAQHVKSVMLRALEPKDVT